MVSKLSWPLRPHVHAQLARAAESLVSAALPTRAHAARAFAGLAGLLEGTLEEEPEAPPPKLSKGFSKGRAPAATLCVEGGGGAGGGGCGGASASGGGAAAIALKKLRAVRNYVAARLSAAYGRQGALHLCRVFLEPERWTALKRVCFQDK